MREERREGGKPHLDRAILDFGGDSCDACWVLFADIFCCGSFVAVFVDERNAHVFEQGQAVALLRVDVRILAPVLPNDEAKSFLHIEVLLTSQYGY